LWPPGCKTESQEIFIVLKITPEAVDATAHRVRLCGQFTREYVPELERTLQSLSGASDKDGAAAHSVALDLANVTFVDRDAMVFLCSAKARKIAIENCPSYVTRWIQQENLCGGSTAGDAVSSEPSKP
jgi:ABC-type transporter Mla MlaB component